MAKKKHSGVHVSWPKPDFTKTVLSNKSFKSNFQHAMLYAHYEMTASELHKEVSRYLKAINGKHALLDRIKSMSDERFVTIGKYMYILNNGADIPEEILPKILPYLEKIVLEEETRLAVLVAQIQCEDQGPIVSIQDRLREKAKTVNADINGWFDDITTDKTLPAKTVEDFVSLFRANELKAAHIGYIRPMFKNTADQLLSVIDGKDKFLNEGYSNFTKAEIKKLSTMMANLFQACDMIKDAAKVARTPRQKKAPSIEKLVAKFKFQKDDRILGIASLSPVDIIGAKTVWIYNTKFRKLGAYKASDAGGLGIKGTCITNFSTESIQKTLRKPIETIAEFRKSNRVKLQTFMTTISTTDTLLNGRFSEFCLILKIEK